jgi:hypothetical protein
VISAHNRLRTKEAERWPQLYVRVDKPMGNNYLNSNNSTVAFAGLSYTPSAGFTNVLEAEALALCKACHCRQRQCRQCEKPVHFHSPTSSFIGTIEVRHHCDIAKLCDVRS